MHPPIILFGVGCHFSSTSAQHEGLGGLSGCTSSALVSLALMSQFLLRHLRSPGNRRNKQSVCSGGV